MTNPFRDYAPYYDLLYRDKDYAAESKFVARLLDTFVDRAAQKTHVLDLACGTGRHSQELARMGYTMEGSDLSADMVAVASETAKHAGFDIAFHNESFQTADRIGGTFDAVIAMFSAVCYLTENADISLALQNIRKLLRPGGVFIFDFWNGDAVVGGYSPRREKNMESGPVAVSRTSNTTLDTESRIATIDFDFVLKREGNVVREFSEKHSVRYFFVEEMARHLGANGFEILHRCPFMQENEEISPSDWNVTFVARPIEGK